MLEFKNPTSRDLSISEIKILQAAVPRYLDIRRILLDEENKLSSDLKLLYLKDFLSVYSEISTIGYIKELNETTPNQVIKEMKPFFKFLRNLIVHFPFFKTWDEIQFTREIVLSTGKKYSAIDSYLFNNQISRRFITKEEPSGTMPVLRKAI